jgi:predicted DNA-binding protein
MKTLAIRLDDELHARLTMLSKLAGVTVTDAVRTAIDVYVTNLAANGGELAERAEQAKEDIEREATERREAIESLFGATAPKGTPPAPTSTAKADSRGSRTKRTTTA